MPDAIDHVRAGHDVARAQLRTESRGKTGGNNKRRLRGGSCLTLGKQPIEPDLSARLSHARDEHAQWQVAEVIKSRPTRSAPQKTARLQTAKKRGCLTAKCKQDNAEAAGVHASGQ